MVGGTGLETLSFRTRANQQVLSLHRGAGARRDWVPHGPELRRT